VLVLKAAITYFGLAFGAGFVLGTFRVMVLVPRLGEAVAVALELPIMLTVSWGASRYVVQRFKIAPHLLTRLAVGVVAFLFLMFAELGVSVLGFGRTLAQHLANYATVPAALGLLGQLAFAALPAVQAWQPNVRE
jgi:hypothetical protein